jgi:hypothetical protein
MFFFSLFGKSTPAAAIGRIDWHYDFREQRPENPGATPKPEKSAHEPANCDEHVVP